MSGLEQENTIPGGSRRRQQVGGIQAAEQAPGQEQQTDAGHAAQEWEVSRTAASSS